MTRLLVTGTLLLAFAVIVWANVRNLTDLERIGLSDMIITGTVEEVMNREKSISQNYVVQPTDIAIVRVDKILKGKPSETVDVTNLPVAPPDEKGRVYAGAKLLFFLHQSRNRYKLYQAGEPFLRPVSEEKKIADLIQQFPLIIELIPPASPCSYNQSTKLTVKITNTSGTPIGVSEISLHGFYYAPSMELHLGNNSRVALDGPHVSTEKSTVILPGITYITEVCFAFEKPISWNAYTPELYLLTAAAMRVIVTVDIQTPRKSPQDTYLAASPLVCGFIGFPPPADIDDK